MTILPRVIRPFQRTAWIPLIKEGDNSVLSSKFGGTPWLAQDEQWPRCQHCGQPMPLFLQLNLNRLPEPVNETFGAGLLQLFYCTNTEPHCESECEAFFPFTQGKLVRVVEHDGCERSGEFPKNLQNFEPKWIVDWRGVSDYPGWEEGYASGIELSDAEWEQLTEAGFPRSGAKLAGWPLWIQGIEYPHCPICQSRMRLVFQLDSDDHVAYQFGDAGCGHITQCLIHHSQVAFAWACS
ncbi:hypothetical protein U27_03941 [Candidatus Vecturithrix granuli]|uniref:DUF1963 domain-containing protein n=1 Tax=Vecturithrix granuli TaxID=1499967 RepID=A0A081BXC2_VECG1|nr:hypothetical protein U27_03941 [Candidatus Vecturithrix granuli]